MGTDIPSKFRDLKRFNQVITTLAKYELGFLVGKIGSNKKKQPVEEPEIVRKIMEDLGGSFVKLGQLLSLRPDLIPQKYCDQLSKLQDSVKPFSSDEARKIIRKELGKNASQIFMTFGEKPIAAASIGQVYKAKLKKGDVVAVKIQRPGIHQVMKTDIEIMMFLAEKISSHIKSEIINPVQIVEEFKDYTEKELDYAYEFENIQKFHEAFKESSIRIPKPYKELSTSKILVMEYIGGTKLSEFIAKETNQEKRKLLADELVNSFFKQVFLDGRFHADPHPGNILVLEHTKYVGQKIAFLDFGITGEIDLDVRKNMLSFFIALIDKDIDGIVRSMAELHLISEENPELRKDLREMLGPYYGVALSKINIPKLFTQSMKVSRKSGIKIPKEYILLGKALITVESVCTRIDPEFNLVDSAKPFISRMLAQQYSPEQLAKKAVSAAKSLMLDAREIPGMVHQYFDSSLRQERDLRELSKSVSDLKKDVGMTFKRAVLFSVGTVLLAAAILYVASSQDKQTATTVSAIAFVAAIAAFWNLIKTFK